MGRNAVFTTRKFGCQHCGHTDKVLSWDYDPPPEHCGAPMDADLGQFNKAALVIGDDIPGGLWIRHGLCNEDGSPRRFDTKSAIRAEAKAKGMTWGPLNHTPAPGTDKNPHTTRWI